ncbi:MAG: hypothetical protein ABIF10_01605 [Candidatus Woesearchaeota archaeon]
MTDTTGHTLTQGAKDLKGLSYSGADTLMHLVQYSSLASKIVILPHCMQRDILDIRYKNAKKILERDLTAGPILEGILEQMMSQFTEESLIKEFVDKSLSPVREYNQILREYAGHLKNE